MTDADAWRLNIEGLAPELFTSKEAALLAFREIVTGHPDHSCEVWTVPGEGEALARRIALFPGVPRK